MLLSEKEIVIHEGNWKQFSADQEIDGEKKKRGCIPRPMEKFPVGCYKGSVKAVTFPLIPESEVSERIADQIKGQYRLSDLRNRGNNGQPVPSRDQNGKGYCWRHSPVSAHLLIRCRDNLPYVDLSPYAGACRIKNFRDEGGWGAQGVDDCREYGDPTSEFWPQRSMSRGNDKPATWENAKLHRIDEGWWDLDAAQYNRNLTFQQVTTCLLMDNPCVLDFNWWSHSVCGADVVNGTSMFRRQRSESGKLLLGREFDLVWAMDNPITRGLGIRIWNSWGDSWSSNGMGVLTGNQAIPNGAVCVRTVYATAA